MMLRAVIDQDVRQPLPFALHGDREGRTKLEDQLFGRRCAML